jgi:hypothetical protein
MTNTHYQHVHEYLTFCRWAFETTKAGKGVRFGSWPGIECRNHEEWRREFVLALFRRIDSKAGIVRKGRKYSDEWQHSAQRVARNLNNARIVTRVRECPKELRPRLMHRLHDDSF